MSCKVYFPDVDAATFALLEKEYSSCCRYIIPSLLPKPKAESVMQEFLVWLGMLSAIVHVICIIALLWDIVKGFLKKRFWVPCTFFSLNSFWMTCLSILLLEPTDPAHILHVVKKYSKVSGPVFLCLLSCTAIPSLGYMNKAARFGNLAALGLSIISLISNVFIRLRISHDPYSIPIEAIVAIMVLIICYFIIIYLACVIPSPPSTPATYTVDPGPLNLIVAPWTLYTLCFFCIVEVLILFWTILYLYLYYDVYDYTGKVGDTSLPAIIFGKVQSRWFIGVIFVMEMVGSLLCCFVMLTRVFTSPLTLHFFATVWTRLQELWQCTLEICEWLWTLIQGSWAWLWQRRLEIWEWLLALLLFCLFWF